MQTMNPILSILIISYNQRDLLKKCMRSLLSQNITYPYEIIISDAMSVDGTWDLILDYEREYPDVIKGVKCDTSACINRTECCGWMKLTAYKNARGKYFVNIDADDYLLSNDIYQIQIDALEHHPECSMCMQQILSLKDGDDPKNGNIWPTNKLLIDGAIIDKESFILNDLRGLNQGYMIRRREKDDMESLYGKWFDDTIITLHHLQYGPVFFVNRADYVWVQYKNSISHSQKGDESELIYGTLPLHHAILIPSMSTLFVKGDIKSLIHMFKVLPEYPNINKATKDFMSQFNGFVFKFYTTSTHSMFDKARLKLCRLICLLVNKYNLNNDVFFNLILKLTI